MEKTEFPKTIFSFLVAKQEKRVRGSLFPLGHFAFAVTAQEAVYLTLTSNSLMVLGKD